MISGKRIKILGAGISGMVAGIILAKNGYKVEIFEKRPRIGSFFERDIHSLRNYTHNRNVIEIYKKIGIRIPKTYPIFKEFRFSPSLKKVEIYSKKKPLFYNFIRGYKDKNSLDVELHKTARTLGIKFHFGKNLDASKVDIIATGAGSIKGVAYGAHYRDISKIRANTNYIFLDNSYSPHGYTYIVPFKKEASIVIASTKKEGRGALKRRFNDLKRNNPIVREVLKGARFENEIFGLAFFNFPKTATKKGKLYIGEAAGFLDASTGFGTHYAILSGYLAAKAIIERKNYDKLWRKNFGRELEAQSLRRKKLQKFSNKEYEAAITSLIKKHGERMTAAVYKEDKNKTRKQK